MKLALTKLVLGLATTATVPMIASAHDRDDYRHDRGDWRYRDRHVVVIREREECRDFDIDVRLCDVPRDVIETANCERHGRPIEAVQYVRRDGKLFYRFRIDNEDRHGRDDDFNIRVSPGGRLLSIADAEPNFVYRR
jgi:hypothetical protein